MTIPPLLWPKGVYKEKTNPDKLTEPKRIGFKQRNTLFLVIKWSN